MIAGVLTGVVILLAGSLVYSTVTKPSATPTTPPVSTATGSAAAPSASGSPGTPTVATPAAPALGAWSASCDDADADASALVGNLTGQPQFAVTTPSGVGGFADAALAAAKPLRDCPVAHSLKVRERVKVASDAAATTVVRAKIDAVLRTVVLTLGGDRVGRYTFGSVTLAEAKPVYLAVLGQPDATQAGGCDLGGVHWTELVWGGLRIAFDADAPGQPLHSWSLRPGSTHPTNLAVADGLPLSATLAELRAFAPSVTASSVYANDSPPYAAVPRTGLYYVWDTSTAAKSDLLAGGDLGACD